MSVVSERKHFVDLGVREVAFSGLKEGTEVEREERVGVSESYLRIWEKLGEFGCIEKQSGYEWS